MQPTPDQLRLLRDTLALPTAPFHEGRVSAFIRDFAAARNLPCEADRYGNLAVALRRGTGDAATQPIVLEAHTDHPGLHVAAVDGDTVTLDFLGKAPAGVDLVGTPLLVCRDGSTKTARATVTATQLRDHFYRPLTVTATLDENRELNPREGDFATFDLPTWDLDGTRLAARACDDLAEVAAILCTLDGLLQHDEPVHLTALFTRAEEVGFVGAYGVTTTGLIPPAAVVLSLECSGLPAELAGRGFVIRLADKTSVFDGWVSTRLLQLADERAAAEPDFRYQTPLPRKGTCNASLYAARGYAATGLTLPMQNYHNAGPDGVAPEAIDTRDWATLVSFLGTVCTRYGDHAPVARRINEHLDRVWAGEREMLESSVPASDASARDAQSAGGDA